VGPGDEVICPTFTFCATAAPIVYQGARPVFLDSDPATWNLDPNLLAEELADADRSRRLPKASVVADIYGQAADIDPILDAARRYEIPVVEDAAEALGSTYRGEPVGSRATASIFSFNGNKIITTSGGGMLCCDDPQLIERARHLAAQARDPAPYYLHTQVGYNYRMSNLLAAVGLAQLDALPDRVAARRRNFEFYRARLADCPGAAPMPQAAYGSSNCWLSAFLFDPRFGPNCEAIRQSLEAEDIESRRLWKPLHTQPAYAAYRARGGRVAERLFAQGLCLPSGSALTDLDRQRVVRVVRQCLQAVGRRGRRAA